MKETPFSAIRPMSRFTPRAILHGWSGTADRPNWRTKVGIIAWLIVGLIAGWIGHMVVNRSGGGFVGDLIIGAVGAFVGGFLFNLIGHSGVTGLNLYSILVAAVGAIVVLVIWHAIRGRTTG
jgi:uncharacterized membrane protein YeaQ/YmgE (transglycosylase-associated protein family)